MRKSTGRHNNWETTNWATRVGQLGDNVSFFMLLFVSFVIRFTINIKRKSTARDNVNEIWI